MNRARIEDWQVINNQLVGRVLDHPDQESFTTSMQATSPILMMIRHWGMACTENTLYTLGKEFEEEQA